MEDIQVGEFIRTKDGYIGKYIKKSTVHKCVTLKDNEISWVTFENNISKHNKNIIDLLEDEDIVELEYKSPKYRERISRLFVVERMEDYIYFENKHCSFFVKANSTKIKDDICKNIVIKSIVTKEQFNSVKYEVER